MKIKPFNQYLMPNNKSLPLFFSYNHYEVKDDTELILSIAHVHPEIELLTNYGCDIEYATTDGVYHKIKKGETVIFNSYTPHATKISEYGHYACALLQFKKDDFVKQSDNDYKKYFNIIAENADKGVYVTGDKKLSDYIDDIIKNYSTDCAESNMYMASDIYGIIGYLYNIGMLKENQQTGTKLKRLVPVLNYITKHYNSDISLSETAQLSQMSEHYFCRYFKDTTGINFTEYLNFVRIYEAKK